jgi:acetyltransferase-like isoleucine patch superfamily enzyme
MAEKLFRLYKRIVDRVLTMFLSTSFRSFGSGSAIVFPIRVNNLGSVEVGKNVYFGEHCWINVIGDNSDGPKIQIGSGVGLAGYCVISAAASIVIAENVLVARNVYISDHQHTIDSEEQCVRLAGIDHIRSVRIGRGAWLCQNVVVCPGVTIGEGAVIGANSVVKGDIPPFAVAAGIPATVRRFRRGVSVKT